MLSSCLRLGLHSNLLRKCIYLLFFLVSQRIKNKTDGMYFAFQSWMCPTCAPRSQWKGKNQWRQDVWHNSMELTARKYAHVERCRPSRFLVIKQPSIHNFYYSLQFSSSPSSNLKHCWTLHRRRSYKFRFLDGDRTLADRAWLYSSAGKGLGGGGGETLLVHIPREICGHKGK
jgi:hypothetical protein